MRYLDQKRKVVYTSKNGKSGKIFPVLEWLAARCSRITNPGEQMVSYYGYYSNVTQEKRKGKSSDDTIPASSSRREMKKHSGGTGRD
jgi:hypothetical protein